MACIPAKCGGYCLAIFAGDDEGDIDASSSLGLVILEGAAVLYFFLLLHLLLFSGSISSSWASLFSWPLRGDSVLSCLFSSGSSVVASSADLFVLGVNGTGAGVVGAPIAPAAFPGCHGRCPWLLLGLGSHVDHSSNSSQPRRRVRRCHWLCTWPDV